MSIIKTRRIWFFISGTLCLLSLIVLSLWGLKLGIDFTGGSLLDIDFKNERPTKQIVETIINNSGIKETNLQLQAVSEKGYILRMKPLSENEHQNILQSFKKGGYEITEKRFDSIGPVIGQELKKKAIWSIIAVLVAILVYLAWSFRHVSKIVPSWQYGLMAIIALFHDILITVGVFSVLGEFYGYEVGITFIAALLTILGYSVNDTIVVFDRIRENILKQSLSSDFYNTVDKSINQTIARSINTSFTTLLTLFAIYFFGGDTIKDFILALIIGITLGTYSSIFIASPLLLVAQRLNLSNKKN